ncbi:MAG: DUF4351 domain-containing protein [Rhodoferax sp.]|nr:DUF4351 domain-containing protein [Rhodoferax sp.]
MKFIPERLNTPSIHQAFDMINEAGMSAEELEQQHKRREFIFMQRDALEKAQADGWAEGKAEGVQTGEALALQRLLHKRFGALSAEILHRITTASVAQIDDWLDRVLGAASLEEVFHEARH